MKSFLLGVFCAAVLCFAQTTEAQVLIRIGDVEVQAGQTARIPVSIHSVAGELVGYDFPVEIGEDGRGLPGGLTLARDSADERETFSSVHEGHRSPFAPPEIFKWEVVYSDVAGIDQAPLQFTPQGVHLFDIVIDVPRDYEGYTSINIPREGLAAAFLTLVMQGTVGTFEMHPDNIVVDNGSLTVVPDGIVLEKIGEKRRRR